MTMRRMLSLTLPQAFLLAAFLGCQQPQPTQQSELKIGAVVTLTGGTAYWSTQLQRGMEMALAETNDQTHVPVRVIYEDVQGKPQEAVSAFQKLRDSDHVSVAISVFTPIGQPLRPLAEEAQLPLLATITSVRDFSKGYKWTFHDFITQDQMAAPLGTYAVSKLGLKAGAALVVNDDYGRDGARAFRDALTRKGGRWLGDETFAQSDVDIRSQAAKVSALKPDVVLVVGRDQSLGLAIKQLNEAGFRGQLMSVNCLDSPAVWRIAGGAAENALFTSAFVDFIGNSKAHTFNLKFRARYKDDADYVVVYGYTIAKYLAAVLRNAAGDRVKVAEGLGRLDTDSLRGHLRMDGDHEVLSPVALYQVHESQRRLIEEPSALAAAR